MILATVRDVEPMAVREPEARRLIGNVSRAEFWELRKEGQIESYTIGRARFYPVEALRRFVAGRLAASGAASAA